MFFYMQSVGVPLSRVSQDSIESFCKHCQGAMKITTRSIAQEQHAEVAAEVVQEVLQDDLYQDPIQVSWSVCEFTFRLFWKQHICCGSFDFLSCSSFPLCLLNPVLFSVFPHI